MVGHQNSQAGKSSILQTLILTLLLLIKHSKVLKINLNKSAPFPCIQNNWKIAWNGNFKKPFLQYW